MKVQPRDLNDLRNDTEFYLDIDNTSENEMLAQGRFGYQLLFQMEPPFRPSEEELLELAKAMSAEKAQQNSSKIPAGYTYLAQFIAHDLANDSLAHQFPNGFIAPSTIQNLSKPFLDLDSLYGGGRVKSPHLYESNTRLKLGDTEGENSAGIDKSFPNDLPRKTDSPMAELADERNDENLAIAQTHVFFIKFHNAVVKQLGDDDTIALFEKAREIVIRHYQWIILHDFLPHVIKESVLTKVLENDTKYYKPNPSSPFIPLEFAVAAFRLSHSMVRHSYQWNKFFREGGSKEIAKLSDLMIFTGRGEMMQKNKLPSIWLIDWRRFYDFTGNVQPDDEKFNFASKIDTEIASPLNFLPGGRIGRFDQRFSLPARDLFRGRAVGLPTGQFIADIIKNDFGVPVLTPKEIRQILPKTLRNVFAERTPLWYYILAEAQIQEKGERLGEVGSRIVAEAFVALIAASQPSIIKDKTWQPDVRFGAKPGGEDKPNIFRMPEFLNFVAAQNSEYDELNPLD